MVVFLSFEEIRKYVAKHYGQRIMLSRVNEKELCAEYVRHVLIKDVKLRVNIHIDDVRRESVIITYKGGVIVKALISKALDMLMSRMPELKKGITIGANQKIRVNPAEIEKAKSVVKNIMLQDIGVEERGVKLTALLK